jgi:hypothetical protein
LTEVQSGSTEFSSRHDRRTIFGAPRAEVVVLLLIAIAALALRWWRLDLVSFRYDSAEAAFRARETLKQGFPPLTGIVNSHGFRNAPGFIYLILPPFLFSPDIRLAVAWNSFLELSGILPLFLLARRRFGKWHWLLPCVAYAFLPMLVAGSRSLWAQNLVPPVGAWALLLLDHVRDMAAASKSRGRAGVALVAVLGLGMSVHFSCALWAAFSLAAAWRPLVKAPLPRRYGIIGAAVAVVCVLSFVPSIMDWNYRRDHPLEKPEHVLQFEAQMGAPDPAWIRISKTYRGFFDWFASDQAESGAEIEMPTEWLRSVAIGDLIYVVLMLAGIARALVLVMRRQHPLAGFATLVLAWAFVPALPGALFISRVNSSYFVCGLPALLLLPAFAIAAIQEKYPANLARALPVAGLLVAALWLAFYLEFVHIVNTKRFIRGQYYIPLAEQRKTAQALAKAGIRRGGFTHISGDWFQRPYEYLLEQEPGAAQPARADEPHAVMEDSYLRRDEPIRLQFLQKNFNIRVGSVGILLFPNEEVAQTFLATFWSLPPN